MVFARARHQQVAPRRERGVRSVALRGANGWQARQLGTRMTQRPVRANWRARSAGVRALLGQRGSVTSSTVTVAFALISLVSVALLGFLYLSQVFGTASQGGDIQSLESQVVDLKERQRELELEGAELRSIQTVEERVEQLNLVATDSVAYLAPTSDRVALESFPAVD